MPADRSVLFVSVFADQPEDRFVSHQERRLVAIDKMLHIGNRNKSVALNAQ